MKLIDLDKQLIVNFSIYIKTWTAHHTGRKIGFKQICNWCKYDVNLGLQIWPKFALEAMLMQTQIFIPVVFARKCEVNMISTLHLLRFCYLRKSTNLTYIYTYLLSLQSIAFAFGTKSRQTWCKSICLHHCLTNVTKSSNENIFPCFTPVLLQEQICSCTLHLYYYQTKRFARITSCLLSTQIWLS